MMDMMMHTPAPDDKSVAEVYQRPFSGAAHLTLQGKGVATTALTAPAGQAYTFLRVPDIQVGWTVLDARLDPAAPRLCDRTPTDQDEAAASWLRPRHTGSALRRT